MGSGKGIEVSFGTLDKVHGSLSDGHSQIEGLGKSIPQGVDAGVLAGPLEELLAGFVDNAAEYSTALGELANTVSANSQAYERAEQQAHEGFQHIHGGR